MAKVAEKLIESIIYTGSQSINLREIYSLGKQKIKIEIKSDSFNQQCYAHAYALDGLEWKLIYSIPYSKMNTKPELIYYSAYSDGKEAKARPEFEKDLQQLKQYIKEILD